MTDQKDRAAQTGQRPGTEHQDKSHQDKSHLGNKPGTPGRHDDKVGKDTDDDGRVVQPGDKPGEVDGDRQHGKK
jgi:hypothetical protein